MFEVCERMSVATVQTVNVLSKERVKDAARAKNVFLSRVPPGGQKRSIVLNLAPAFDLQVKLPRAAQQLHASAASKNH